MSEEDLAKTVIQYLIEHHWEVYQEVPLYGPIVDLVAVQSNRLWAIECKKNLGFAVVGQALYWKRYAHYVSVATEDKRTRDDNTARRVLGLFGLGWIVTNRGWGRPTTEMAQAQLSRTILPDLRDALRPEHKTFCAAGSASATRFTPFQETALAILRHTQANPGCTLRTVIETIKTHYASTASAMSNIPKWIESGAIKGVKLHKKGKHLLLYPVDHLIPDETAYKDKE